jgi:hypothetical protein
MAAYGRACCCAGIHCSSSPTFSPIKIFKVQITNKCSKEIPQPKPLLIVNKKMRIYSSVSIEASLMLPVVHFSPLGLHVQSPKNSNTFSFILSGTISVNSAKKLFFTIASSKFPFSNCCNNLLLSL